MRGSKSNLNPLILHHARQYVPIRMHFYRLRPYLAHYHAAYSARSKFG